MRTVWIYADNTKMVGDEDHLIVFESPGVFERWKETHDPEAMAFEYVVIEPGNLGMIQKSVRCSTIPAKPLRGNAT